MAKALGQFAAEVEGVRMGMQTYHVALEEEDGWFVVQCVELPGAISQGRTREEARTNVIDALRLMLAPDDGDPHVARGRSEPLELILAG